MKFAKYYPYDQTYISSEVVHNVNKEHGTSFNDIGLETAEISRLKAIKAVVAIIPTSWHHSGSKYQPFEVQLDYMFPVEGWK